MGAGGGACQDSAGRQARRKGSPVPEGATHLRPGRTQAGRTALGLHLGALGHAGTASRLRGTASGTPAAASTTPAAASRTPGTAFRPAGKAPGTARATPGLTGNQPKRDLRRAGSTPPRRPRAGISRGRLPPAALSSKSPGSNRLRPTTRSIAGSQRDLALIVAAGESNDTGSDSEQGTKSQSHPKSDSHFPYAP